MKIEEARQLIIEDMLEHRKSNYIQLFLTIGSLCIGIFAVVNNEMTLAIFCGIIYAGETIAISVDMIWKVLVITSDS